MSRIGWCLELRGRVQREEARIRKIDAGLSKVVSKRAPRVSAPGAKAAQVLTAQSIDT